MTNGASVTSKEQYQLSELERTTLENNIAFKQFDTLFKYGGSGLLAQLFIGSVFSTLLYKKIDHPVLFLWDTLFLLVLASLYWLVKAYQVKAPPAEKIQPWRKMYLLALSSDVALWGAAGFILMPSTGFSYQIFIIFVMFALSAGFSQGTMPDIAASRISVTALLLPTIAWCLTQKDTFFIGLAVILTVYMLFLLRVTSDGYRMFQESLELRFKNAILNEKLESTNEVLEQRVEERTLELKKSLGLVTHQATHDLLTNLPNQRMLITHLKTLISTADTASPTFLVVFFAIDRFKLINDSVGHVTGDIILKKIAHRLRTVLSKNPKLNTKSVVGRMSGDIYALLLSHIPEEEWDTTLQTFHSIMEKPFHLENQEYILTASMGVSIYPRDGDNPKALLMNAESAMFRAKKSGGNCIVYYLPEINARSFEQLQMENYLRHCVEHGELLVNYQPFVDMHSSKITGMEALLRWNHPKLGLISPMTFIPLAEEVGAIISMGEWILRTACQQTKEWQKQGYPLHVSVNFSFRQFRQKNILELITGILKETQLEPQYLNIEITESVIADNIEESILLIKKMKDFGFSVSLDDFGTGYSSLSYLKKFPVDTLKIDKSFVQGIGLNLDDEAITLAIIAMAQKLGMKTLAEGVETKQQLDFLKANGCDTVQGYYFSRPLDTAAFTNFIAEKFKDAKKNQHSSS